MNTDAYRDLITHDRFEAALALDAVLVGFERRTAGKLVHAPVDAELLLLSPDTAGLPVDDLYERICEIERLIKALPSKRREELLDALVADRRRVPWRAMRGSQAQTYELASEVDIVLAAGGGGSGKTEAVLATALFQCRNARFLRKTSMEFQPLLKRIAQIAGSTDGRNLANMSWDLPAPFGHDGKGVSIEMTSVNDPDSHLRAQGRAVDGLFPDDVGNAGVSRESIFYVANWLRSAENIPKKLVMTSNPPSNADALWLKSFFAPWLDEGYTGTPAASGEVRHFVFDGDESVEVPAGTEGAQSRVVIMSTVLDNPRLVRSGYVQTLRNSPSELLRKRLLENDWAAGWTDDQDLQVIPGAWVDAAMARWSPQPPAGVGMDAVGIDTARGGKDRSGIVCRFGDYFATPKVLPGSSTPDGPALAAHVLPVIAGHTPILFVESDGVGGATVDALRRHTERVAPVTVGAGANWLDKSQSFGFANVRSAIWWAFRELLDPTNPRKIALPPDRVLRTELTCPRYELRGGRLHVESRDDVVRRNGRSLDVATAFVLAAIDCNSTLASPARGFRAALRRCSYEVEACEA